MSRPPTPPTIAESTGESEDIEEPDVPPPPKNVRWGTIETKERSTYADLMSRSLGQGILRVYYSRWMARTQFRRLELKNASLQRMLGDSSQLVTVKVKLLGEEVTKKAARIKELESKLATASILKKRKSSSMSAASLAQAAQLNEKGRRVEELEREVERLNAELKLHQTTIKEKDTIINNLKDSLEKANEAILSGADQYHESAVELHQARETLVHTAVSLSPKRDLSSLPSMGGPSEGLLPSAAAISKHRSRSFPAKALQQNEGTNSRVVSEIINTDSLPFDQQRSLESAKQLKSDSVLTVEHHLADLIRRHGLTGQPAQQSSEAQQNLMEDRQFLESILHQIQLDKLHSSHVGNPQNTDMLVQDSIRRLLRHQQQQQQQQQQQLSHPQGGNPHRHSIVSQQSIPSQAYFDYGHPQQQHQQSFSSLSHSQNLAQQLHQQRYQ